MTMEIVSVGMNRHSVDHFRDLLGIFRALQTSMSADAGVSGEYRVL